MAYNAIQAARDSVSRFANSEEHFQNIIKYCGSSYQSNSNEGIVEETKKYLEDLNGNIGEYLLGISEQTSEVIDDQHSDLLKITEDMDGAVHRITGAEDYMAKLFSMGLCTYHRPIQSIQLLSRRLPKKEIPKWAREKRP